jgi:hypothetical protein
MKWGDTPIKAGQVFEEIEALKTEQSKVFDGPAIGDAWLRASGALNVLLELEHKLLCVALKHRRNDE